MCVVIFYSKMAAIYTCIFFGKDIAGFHLRYDHDLSVLQYIL